MNQEENNKTNKTGDIHLRCYQEDKDFLIQRAKDGFGRKENSMTNVMLYALRHIDDTSPITLSYVDGLIRAISENRQSLDAVHADISGISDALNAIGHNINQIAKGINTILKVAREDGEDVQQTVAKITSFEGEVKDSIRELSGIMDGYEKIMRSARTIVNSCLRKEDEILTKTLAHPRVGEKQRLEAQLLRLLEEYSDGDQTRMERMNVSDLIFELREKVKAGFEGKTKNKERE